MNDGYGIQTPSEHVHKAYREPARWLVVIDEAGMAVARLFLESREEVAQFDAGTEEVTLMTRGLEPAKGGDAAEWDRALRAHTTAERAAADIYRLPA